MSAARMRLYKTVFANFSYFIPSQAESNSYLLTSQSDG